MGEGSRSETRQTRCTFHGSQPAARELVGQECGIAGQFDRGRDALLDDLGQPFGSRGRPESKLRWAARCEFAERRGPARRRHRGRPWETRFQPFRIACGGKQQIGVPHGKSPGVSPATRADVQDGLVQAVGKRNIAARIALDVRAAQYLGDSQVTLVLADPGEQLQRQVLRHAGHCHHGCPCPAGSLTPPSPAAIVAGQDQPQLTDGPAVQVVDKRDGPQRQCASGRKCGPSSSGVGGKKDAAAGAAGDPAFRSANGHRREVEYGRAGRKRAQAAAATTLPRLPVKAIQPPSPTSQP